MRSLFKDNWKTVSPFSLWIDSSEPGDLVVLSLSPVLAASIWGGDDGDAGDADVGEGGGGEAVEG